MKKHILFISAVSLIASLSCAHAQSKTVTIQSTDNGLINNQYAHKVGTPIPSPEPLWWPAWKDAIERARKIILKKNDGKVSVYINGAAQDIKLNEGEYQYFSISHGPTWRDGDLEIMASVTYNLDYCDEIPNSSTYMEPFEYCIGAITTRNTVNGEVKTFKTTKKICNIGEVGPGIDPKRAQTTVALDRKMKTVTFNALYKGKAYPNCKVTLKYE